MYAITSRLALLLILFSTSALADTHDSRDLVALQFDRAADDEQHRVLAANLALARALNLDLLLVGAHSDRPLDADVSVATSLFDGEWLDATAQPEQVRQHSVDRWSQALQAGADVWVVEAGYSSFTASVVRQIREQWPTIDTQSRIHVVQRIRSGRALPGQTVSNNISAQTDYRLIDVTPAPLESTGSEISGSHAAMVNGEDYSGVYRAAWRETVARLFPHATLDISYAAELLHVLANDADRALEPARVAKQIFAKQDGVAPPSSPQYWTDSYAVDGQCFCDTTFDHELEGIVIDTPTGRLPIYQVCADIQRQHGEGSQTGRLYYNTVQCGHEPANNSPDEIECPGFLTDDSGAWNLYNCNAKGASWNLDQLYDGANGFVARGPDDGSIAVCLIPDADTDGDGYGWQSGASCVVQDEDTTPETRPTIDTEAPSASQNNRAQGSVIKVGGGAVSPKWLFGCLLLSVVCRRRYQHGAIS